MKKFLLSVAVVGLVAGGARAGIIYSNFDPGMSFGRAATFILGPNTSDFFGDQQAAAAPFTPASNFVFRSVELPLDLVSGTNNVTVQLRTSFMGVPSSTVLESFTVTGLTGSAAVFTENSTMHPLLQQGTQYWITLFPGGSDTEAEWNFNDTGATGRALSNDGGANWSTDSEQSAFEVDGDPVGTPEPGSLALLGMGLASLAAGAWWRKTRTAANRAVPAAEAVATFGRS